MELRYLFSFLIVACSGSNFSGDSNIRRPAEQPAVEQNSPSQPQQPVVQNNPQSSPQPNVTPGPTAAPNNDKKDDADDPGFLQTLINILTGGDNKKDSDTVINFGEDNQVFHIGDSEFEASSCKVGLLFKEVVGTRFHFTFTVTESDSRINIQIREVCGVDYTIDEAKLLYNGQEITRLALTPLQRNISFPQQVLNPGQYEIVVESPQNFDNEGDRDNFKVGNVRVESSARIIKGEVRAD